MGSWDTPFDESMLGREKVVINCPYGELVSTLTQILDEHNVRYGDGDKASWKSFWDDYKENACFYVNEQKRLWHGPKSSTKDYPWSEFFKCTFYLEPESNIDEEDYLAVLFGGTLS